MIRRHDRYLLKSYWTNFGAVLVFLTILSVVFDLSERFSRITRNWDVVQQRFGEDPMTLLLEFYATRVVFLWFRIVPFCVPAAAIFSLLRLNRHNELTPLVTAGVSMRRVVFPIVLSAVVIAGAMLFAREYFVPDLSRTHMRVNRVLSDSTPDRETKVPHFHDPSGARLSADAFLPLGQKLEAAWVTFRDPEGRLTESYWYPELQWDPERELWYAPRGGQKHVPIDGGKLGARRSQLDAGVLAPIRAHVSLMELSLLRGRSSGFSFTESRELIDANPTNPRFVTLHHQMITTPVSCVILLLLVLPFCAKIGRRAPIKGILGSLGMAALFYGANYLFASLGGAGDLNPIALAWMPTAIFGSLGLALYLGMD